MSELPKVGASIRSVELGFWVSHLFSTSIVTLAAASLITAFGGSSSSAASTYTKLYSFCAQSNCTDGAFPRSSPVMDADGNLYGVTTAGGGDTGEGVAFALIKKKGGYTYRNLYSFCSRTNCTDGGMPSSRLIVDINGALYGVTSQYGKFGAGVVYKLSPNARKTKWKFQILYDFCSKTNCADGTQVGSALTYVGAGSGAVYDGTSPLFGTAYGGGKYAGGAAFQLTSIAGKTRLKEDVIYSFCAQSNCTDGGAPNELISDVDGNLFGTTDSGGSKFGGVLFKITPKASGRFKQTVLYTFCSLENCTDGAGSQSRLALGSDGSLNGSTVEGGANNEGTVFSFLPSTSTETVLYSFCGLASCTDGVNPLSAGVAIDATGVMFGTTANGGGTGRGVAYSLKNGTEQVLKSFCEEENCTDGSSPIDGVILDSSGRVFGTAQTGGDNRGGVVFEIKP